MNLIKELAEKLHSIKNAIAKSKIVKGGIAFAMALTIAASASACGCAHTDTPPDPDHTVTDPNNPNSGTTDPTNPYSQYSQILQDVLNSEYYNDAINSCTKTEDYVYLENSQILHAAPYGFFEQQGHNIDEIKKNNLQFSSRLYIKDTEPNNLYIATNVETKSSQSDYFTNYLLKYTLTNDELKDFKMLFEGDYIQAYLFVQQLSYDKTPTVVSEFKIEVDAYNKIVAQLNKKQDLPNVFTSQKVDFINFYNFEPDNRSCYLGTNILVQIPSSNNVCTLQLGSIDLILVGSDGWRMEDNIFKLQAANGLASFNEDKEVYKNSITEVNYYRMATNSALYEFK